MQQLFSKPLRFLMGILLLVVLASGLEAKPVTIEGIQYYSLKDLGKNLGLAYHGYDMGKHAILKNHLVTLSFRNWEGSFTLNGFLVILERPIRQHHNKLCISAHDYKNTVLPILMPRRSGLPPKLRTIIIDAGHGGKDPGTSSQRFNVQEKVMALDVAKRLQKELKDAGLNVLLTRNHDVFLELQQRSQLANLKNADLFISIHFNAVQKSPETMRGVETYVLRSLKNEGFSGLKQNNWNVLAAYNIQTSLRSGLKAVDRGVRRANFKVLKDLTCPGVLVECGFISNDDEVQQIKSPLYRQKIAESLADGVKRYQRTLQSL